MAQWRGNEFSNMHFSFFNIWMEEGQGCLSPQKIQCCLSSFKLPFRWQSATRWSSCITIQTSRTKFIQWFWNNVTFIRGLKRLLLKRFTHFLKGSICVFSRFMKKAALIAFCIFLSASLFGEWDKPLLYYFLYYCVLLLIMVFINPSCRFKM